MKIREQEIDRYSCSQDFINLWTLVRSITIVLLVAGGSSWSEYLLVFYCIRPESESLPLLRLLNHSELRVCAIYRVMVSTCKRLVIHGPFLSGH